MPVPAPTATFPSSPTIPLHRVRFFDHTPSPITALAFSPTPLPPATDPSAKGKAKQVDSLNGGRPEIGVLILARENGEVEIWEWVAPEDMSRGNWVLEKVLPPTLTHPGVSLMALVLRDPSEFHQKPYRVPKLADLRLYTAGSDSGDLVERCLMTGRILQTYSVPAPPIWALAVSPTHSTLALATTSPSLHFLSLTPSGLEPPPGHLLRCDSLPSRTRTVSLAWGPPRTIQSSSGGWEWIDTYLVSGNSDSSFRKWEIPSSDPNTAGSGRVTIKGRSVVEKIKATKRGPKGTIVWGTAVLPDHTIVTSDSLGSVIFWDGASLAQKKAFKAHKADGMVLIPGPGGRTIFTGGPDQRVCQFTLVNGDWQQTATKRLHSHDIRALAVFPAYTPAPAGTLTITSDLCPVLASGGWDMGLILTPCAPPDLTSARLRNPLGRPKGPSRTVFEEAYTRRMSYLGGGKGTGRISVSASSRLVIGRKERSIGIWRIFEDEQGWEKVLEMDLKLRTTLISSGISDDGKWLAVSDLYETKLFRLTTTPGGSLVPKRVKTFVSALTTSSSTSHLDLENTGTGSASLLFTPDSGRLILGLAISGQILILELGETEGNAGIEVVKCFSRSEGGSAARVIKPAKHGRTERRKARAALMAEKEAMPPPEIPNGNVGDVEKEEEVKMVEQEQEEEEVLEVGTVAARVSCMAVSGDGQWLAVSDLSGKAFTFNMDTLRPHSVLPTFPHSPLSLNFPPTHPSLLMLTHPSQSLTFYQMEQRRLLPPTTQLAILNRALADQFLPIQSSTFQPLHPGSKSSGKAAKLVIWSTDWVCTAKLDLDQIGRVNKLEKSSAKALERNLRKKRAREARQQLERTSLSASSPSLSNSTLPSTPTATGLGSPLSRQVSNDPGTEQSSSDDPDFFRFTHDRFRCVAAVEWVGEGEMVVVERPLGDFVGELPAVFWTGGFGRS